MRKEVHEQFDVSDVEAEMAAKKAAEMAKLKTARSEAAAATQPIKRLKQEAGWEEKIAKAKRNIALAEGTGEIPLTDEDIEDIPDLTSEAEEEK